MLTTTVEQRPTQAPTPSRRRRFGALFLVSLAATGALVGAWWLSGLPAITVEVGAVPGVQFVDVDLETKLVVAAGAELHDQAIRAAIGEGGYGANPSSL